jgi:hypothetical protein
MFVSLGSYSLKKQIALPLMRTFLGETKMASSGFVMQISISVGRNEGHAGENAELSNWRPKGIIPPPLPSL